MAALHPGEESLVIVVLHPAVAKDAVLYPLLQRLADRGGGLKFEKAIVDNKV